MKKKRILPKRSYRVVAITGCLMMAAGVIMAAYGNYPAVTGYIDSISEKSGVFPTVSTSAVQKLDTGLPDDGPVDCIIMFTAKTGVSALDQQGTMKSMISSLGGDIRDQYFWSVNAMNVIVDAENLSRIAGNSQVSYIYPNEPIVRLLDTGLEWDDYVHFMGNNGDLLQANYLHDEGITGEGLTVFVIDSGINPGHPDLQRNGKSVVIGSYNPAGVEVSLGHGTAVAGCIASQNPGYPGIAPGCDIISINVFDTDGSGYPSWILDGVDYIAEYARNHDGCFVSSNSWGISHTISTQQSCQPSPFHSAFNTLATRMGIPVVFAAGNDGAIDESQLIGSQINDPADADNVIAVGSVNDALYISSFSSRGPSCSHGKKPDLVAPGSSVHTLNVSNGDCFVTGTSFAAPQVSACLGLIYSQFGDRYSVSQYYDALREGTRDLGPPGYDYDYGYGLVQAYDSYLIIQGEIPLSTYSDYGTYVIIIGLVMVCIPFIASYALKPRK